MARQVVCTQMIIVHLRSGLDVRSVLSGEGKQWSAVVHALKSRAEVRRLYWGLHVEEPNAVHLHIGVHMLLVEDSLRASNELPVIPLDLKSVLTPWSIVRERLHQHYDFLSSSDYISFKSSLRDLITGDLIVRHANLVEFTPQSESLGRGAPFTGTAIYLDTDQAWDFAWQLWATIVPTVKGCMGVAGGYIVEPVDGHQRCFIAWVGWETIEDHENYHRTKHWQHRRAILEQGQKGYKEYGHVAFVGGSQGPHL